jgi:hypothetical protein
MLGVPRSDLLFGAQLAYPKSATAEEPNPKFAQRCLPQRVGTALTAVTITMLSGSSASILRNLAGAGFAVETGKPEKPI